MQEVNEIVLLSIRFFRSGISFAQSEITTFYIHTELVQLESYNPLHRGGSTLETTTLCFLGEFLKSEIHRPLFWASFLNRKSTAFASL